MDKVKTLGANTLVGLLTSASVLGSVAYAYFPSKEQFNKLYFQVQVNQLRLDSAFGPLKLPGGFTPSSTSFPPSPSVVHAAEEEPRQKKLEAYRKALSEHAVDLPESFIRACGELGFWKGSSPAVYKFEGPDGRQYSGDQTIACMIRLMGYK